MVEMSTFDAIQITLASPETILEWSYGEVKKPETINYRTLKPERDGLFCERIFGPTKDWECHCGKYKRMRNRGIICDKCGVEVTRQKVRRERMGHIQLAAPVSHIWYFKGIPSRMGLILDLPPRSLERVLYFASYIMLDPGETGYKKMDLLTDKEYRDLMDQHEGRFRAGMGAEAVKELLMQIDLDAMCIELREALTTATGQKKIRITKRLEVAESLRKSGNRPEWMIMDVIPVIPPEIRPMVQLDGGRFATSDLNDLYRRVINRNNRLLRLLDLGAPDIIVRNEKRMLQEAVDALIDNGRRGRPVTGPGNRPLKSLSDMLRGKQGRFRQNLLGKRVDYSGRSVIVVGPELKFWQCGLPKEMALELFKPFVMKRLVQETMAPNIKGAKRMIERLAPVVWDVLEEVIKEHPVLLNRAPTLHRLGIQAFEPVLVEGRALKLHPLVCTAYNADFDGDQMAVHVPLSIEAQAEARFLMLSVNNILKPSDGKPVVGPSQDMVIGAYYMTIVRDREEDRGKAFSNPQEAIMAYQTGTLALQSLVDIRFTGEFQGKTVQRTYKTTAGRVLYNEAIPQDIGYVDRDDPQECLRPEIDFIMDRKGLLALIERCYRKFGNAKTVLLLDGIKSLGFRYSTKGAVTVSVADLTIPEQKKEMVAAAEQSVEKIQAQFRRGLISDEERYRKVVDTWQSTTAAVTKAMQEGLDEFNPVYMMSNSGARGSTAQLAQLAAMRGMVSDPTGKVIELPIRANYREGLTILEYFISSHGARKGLADTALRTADSGYLTRRMVDVSQDVIIREDDCFATAGERVRGMAVEAIAVGDEVIESLEDRLVGRVAAEDLAHPTTGELLLRENEMITMDQAKAVVAAGIKSAVIRTVLTCRAQSGVCAKCYGANLTHGRPADIGEAVGIMAAQSIGEPGTQLTMRTFHTGGVATTTDITAGLPRVEELFEARKPKGQAVICEIPGTVRVNSNKKKIEVEVSNDEDGVKIYAIPYGAHLLVTDGQTVEAGDSLTAGSINPHDILQIRGLKGVQAYLLSEVQMVYRRHASVTVGDKHLEIIVRQMMRKVRIEDAGGTTLLPGELVDTIQFENENLRAMEQGLQPAIAKRVLLGITKAALATESFLSAASFQETTRVLTEAAIKGKVDPLVGLKENVIIGKLIPAGTGMRRYRDTSIEVTGTNPLFPGL